MNQEHRYSLTRVCLRRGELSLPRSLRGIFPEDSSVTAVDSTSGSRHDLRLQGTHVLAGMDAFFREHDLEVNDTILIRPGEDGTITLTPKKRDSRPDYSSSHAVARIVNTIQEAAPVTESEARALLKGLPSDFDLAGLLEESGKFQLKAGRWHDASTLQDDAFDRQVDAALAQATARHTVPPARGSQVARHAEAGPIATLAAVGFEVEDLGEGFWLLDSAAPGSPAPGFKAVMHLLSPQERLDWARLLERRRQHAADFLAVAGTGPELQQLKAPAELAHATLWDEAALTRLEEIALTVPLGPVDLESHFRHDGLSGAGFDRFERTMQARVAERGAFSLVLTNLSTMAGPGSFRLEDAARGVDREVAARVLDQLSRSPFQLVLRREGGEWYLRQSVQRGLQQLAEYASSLQEQLPRAGNRQPAARRRYQNV